MATQNDILSIRTMNSGIRFILQVGLKDSNIMDYQIEMINQNAKDTLIQIEKAIVADSTQLHYDITGLQSLGEYLSKNTLNKKLLLNILDNICEILSQWESYFLNPNNYLLDLSYIFIDIKTNKIKMIYVPIEEQLDVDINKSFKTLLKEIIVDYAILEDTALDDYLYKILNSTKAIDFSIENFRKTAIQLLNEKPIKNKEETRSVESKPITEKQVETIEEKTKNQEEYKLVYKTSVKIIASAIQPIILLSFALIFFVMPKILGESILLQVSASLLMIGIDVFVLIVLFNKNNKVKVLVRKSHNNATHTRPVKDNTDRSNNNVSVNSNHPSVNLSKREIVTQLSYDTEVLDSSFPYLLANQGGTVDKIFINKDVFKLGRLEELNDYTVQAKPVGKEHAEIYKSELDYKIKDLNSKNGTFLNGKRLEPGASELLRDGDEIILANISFKFKVM